MNPRNNNEKYQFLLFGVLLGAIGYYYYAKENTPAPSGGGASGSLPSGSGAGSCGCKASALMITPVMSGITKTRI